MVASPDRGQAIIDDPEAYFEEARKRARAIVERDLQRERGLTHA